MKNLDWKTLESDYILQEPYLTVRCDRVALPNGRIIEDYYVLEYPTWVNVIAITKDGKMVIVRQYRHGLGHADFELVAGMVDQGEKPIDAAKRELAEETGYTGGEWHELMVISANPTSMNNLTHCFVATGVEKAVHRHLDPTEDIEVYLYEQQEVREMLYRGQFVQSLMVAPLTRYFLDARHD